MLESLPSSEGVRVERDHARIIARDFLVRREDRDRPAGLELTGTPLLSSVARITELASLCAGTCAPTWVEPQARHTRPTESSPPRAVLMPIWHAQTWLGRPTTGA